MSRVLVRVDENLPREVADVLRDAGHDAVTVGDQALGGQPDGAIAAVAAREARALISLDLDFADVRAYPPENYAGLLVLRLRRQDKPYVLSVVRRLLPILEREAAGGHLWIIEDDRVRIRP